MKILVLSTDYKPRLGGIAELAFHVCKQLAAHGHEVEVVTQRHPDCPDQATADGVRVHRVFDPRPPVSIYSATGAFRVPCWTFRTRRQIRRHVRRTQPDVIFCTNPKSIWLSIVRRAKCPYAVFVHGDDVAADFTKRNPIPAMLTSRLIRGAGWTFFNSSYSLSVVEKGLSMQLDRASAVGCGFPVDDLVTDDLRDSARAELGWDDSPVLLSVSRLVLRKGIDTVLRAMERVRKAFPNCRYVVAGDGPDRAKLEALASDLSVAERVEFVGRVDDELRRRLYLAAHLYVMPSRPGPSGEVEGFGISFLEANAHGLAVIGSTAGGVPDAVADGVNGLLVPPDDPGALAGAIGDLLNQPRRREEMARAGQQRIRDQYNWRSIVARIEERLVAVAGGEANR